MNIETEIVYDLDKLDELIVKKKILTLGQVDDQAGMHRGYMHSIMVKKNKCCTVETLYKLSKFFKVPMEDLIKEVPKIK